MSFQYFIAGSVPTPTILSALGFTFAKDCELPGRACDRGPNGAPGHCFKLRGSAGVVGHYQNTQTWKLAYGGELWIGWETGKPPGPVELARDDQHPGYDLLLRDGNMWTMPTIRQIGGVSLLPRVHGLNGDGKRERVIAPEHARLWALTEKAWAAFVGGEDGALNDDELYEFVYGALGLNYKIGAEEASALSLFSDADLIKAAKAAVDIPAVMEWFEAQKKKRDAEDVDASPVAAGAAA